MGPGCQGSVHSYDKPGQMSLEAGTGGTGRLSLVFAPTGHCLESGRRWAGGWRQPEASNTGTLLHVCPVCNCPFIPDQSFTCPLCSQFSARAVGIDPGLALKKAKAKAKKKKKKNPWAPSPPTYRCLLVLTGPVGLPQVASSGSHTLKA